jgi:DNA-binding response OmpR family regulator
VLVTALNSEYDVKRGYDEGANVYLTKPFSLATLAERVESLLAPTS